MTTTQAACELRKWSGDTQLQFAERLGCSLRVVLYYEKGRAITGRMLVLFAKLAIKGKRKDLAAIFKRALIDELGVTDIRL